MRKAISLLMSGALIFSASGCAGMKISGAPFYEEGKIDDLIRYLKKSVDKASKKEVKAHIGGQPEITADKDSERWLYSYLQSETRAWNQLLSTSQRSRNRSKTLELSFDKSGLLVNYKINEKDELIKERSEKTSAYSSRVTEGVVAGIIGVGVVLLLDYVKKWLEGKIDEKK